MLNDSTEFVFHRGYSTIMFFINIIYRSETSSQCSVVCFVVGAAPCQSVVMFVVLSVVFFVILF